jgi:hypothetical protein
MHFVTAGCKPAKQEPFIRAAPTVRTFGSYAAPHSFLRFLCELELSLQSRVVHLLPTLSSKCSKRDSFLTSSHSNRDFAGLISKSAPNVTIFSHFEVQIELSLKSGAHFAALYLPKVL